MTLGERIAALRGERKLSQGELAEQLQVSRQSVSKWETDASIPELDKLIALSEIFGVTIDQMVKGSEQEQPADREQTEPSPASPPETVVVHHSISGGKIVGYILLGVGLAVAALGAAISRVLICIGAYLLFCALICLLVRRHPGLVIAWVTLLVFIIVSPYIVGIPVFGVFYPGAYAHGISIGLLLGLLVWVLLLALAVYTFFALRRTK